MNAITLPEQLQALSDATNTVLSVRRHHLPQYGGCDALWDKLHRVGQYLEAEQRKVLAELLRDPEAPRPGQMIEVTTPLPAQSWIDKVLSKFYC